jgi:hypothetical protein
MGRLNINIWEEVKPAPKPSARPASAVSSVAATAAAFVVGAAIGVLALHLAGDDQIIERVWQMVRFGARVG